MPRGVRIRLVLLMAYLAIPIDVIPDFIPVLGYADDAIIVTSFRAAPCVDFVRENGSQMFANFGATLSAGLARMFVTTGTTC